MADLKRWAMKVAIKIAICFLAFIGGINFVLWLASYHSSPVESLAVYLRYPERYGRLESMRVEFARDGAASKIVELIRRLKEDADFKARLVVYPENPRIYHIPRSIIPEGVPFRRWIQESKDDLGRAELRCDSSGKPESIFIGVGREGIFIPLVPGIGPSVFVAALKLSDNPLVFGWSNP